MSEELDQLCVIRHADMSAWEAIRQTVTCPTCDGTREVVVTQHGMGETVHCHVECPDCTDGKIPMARLLAVGAAVFNDDLIYQRFRDAGPQHAEMRDFLRSVTQ